MTAKRKPTWSIALRGRHDDAVVVTTDGTIWLSGDAGLQAVRPNGRRHIRIPGKAAVAALDDGALIVKDSGGVERWDDPAGTRISLRYPMDDPFFLGRAGTRVAFQAGAELHLLDRHLTCVSRFSDPGVIDWTHVPSRLAPEGLYVCGEDGLQICDWQGNVRVLASFPDNEILTEIRASGVAPPPLFTMEGTEARLTDPGCLHRFSRWNVTADADPDLLFACNAMAPFIVICYSRSGGFRWCRCLGRSCCGQRVFKHGDAFVAGTGCGGTVVWFDATGQVLFQTPELTEPSLSHMLWPDLIIPGDGTLHARSLAGLWSYDAQHQRRILRVQGSWQHDPVGGRLLCLARRNGWTRRIWPQSLAAYPLDVAWQC